MLLSLLFLLFFPPKGIFLDVCMGFFPASSCHFGMGIDVKEHLLTVGPVPLTLYIQDLLCSPRGWALLCPYCNNDSETQGRLGFTPFLSQNTETLNPYLFGLF